MNIGGVQAEGSACFVSHWVENGAEEPASETPLVAQEGAMMVVDIPAKLACFVMEDCFGFAIVDTGATRSMAGIAQMEWLQERVYEVLGEDPLELDNSTLTNFTYTNGTNGRSLGKTGIPTPHRA